MKTNKTMVTINLNKPENLNLEKLLSDKLLFVNIRKDDGGYILRTRTDKQLQKEIPALYYFIHVLLERQYTKTNANRCRYDNEFVRMYSRDIEPFKSKNDFKYIGSILKKIGVIDFLQVTEPTPYRKSAQAYYFNLREEYANSIIVQHQVSVKETIAERLNDNSKRFIPKELHNISDINIQIQSAHQYQNLINIKFDDASARQHIDQLLNDKTIEKSRYNQCVTSINNIVNGRIKYSKSNKCDRIYTNVTGMPKELRQFILDSEGNPMNEIDFSSFNAYAVYKIINSLMPDFKSDVEKMAFESELNTYRNLLLSGDFYSSFHQFFFPEEQLSRDQVKEIVLLKWFNAKLTDKNKYRKIMITKLPRISEIIDFLKDKNHAFFSHVTMKLESELVNDIIYKKFIEMHPDAQLYSIFDSFLVEQKYSADLKSMMEEEGSKFFNISCVVKMKNLSASLVHADSDEELKIQPIMANAVEDICDRKCDSTHKTVLDNHKGIIFPSDVPEVDFELNSNWSSHQIFALYKSIFSTFFDQHHIIEMFKEFTMQFNNLSNEEKELIMTSYGDLKRDRYFERKALIIRIRGVCENITESNRLALRHYQEQSKLTNDYL